MQLKEYMRIIAKRGWIILLVAIITTGSALVFSRIQTPVYRSSIFLNVWPARLDWGLQQTIKGLMRNYAGVIASRDTAMEVINRLQLDITPDELREKLTVSPIEADFLIQIDADDYDPLIARDIAQTTAEVFVEDIDCLHAGPGQGGPCPGIDPRLCAARRFAQAQVEDQRARRGRVRRPDRRVGRLYPGMAGSRHPAHHGGCRGTYRRGCSGRHSQYSTPQRPSCLRARPGSLASARHVRRAEK